MSHNKHKSLAEFYQFYLLAHQKPGTRLLHFIGTGLTILSFLTGFLFHDWRSFVAMPFLGYGFAWLGHFLFEKNKPTTFQHPGYSLASDFMLFYDLLMGKQSFRAR